MKIRSLSIPAALVLAICVGLVPSSSADAKDEAPVPKDVPEVLRDVVTGSQYEKMLTDITESACSESLEYLLTAYLDDDNPAVRNALNAVAAGLQDPPPRYKIVNPWKAAPTGAGLLLMMLEHFTEWCEFLPQINGTYDDALDNILYFAWFYYHNQAGRDFVQGRDPLDSDKDLKVGRKFTENFSDQRGEYMNDPASTKYIEQWISNPRIEIEDYQKTRADEFKSWNEFFAREIIVDEETETIPSRPVTMPERDYIVVAPTDCIMNPLVQVLIEEDSTEVLDGKGKTELRPYIETRRYIENPLDYDTVLDVKGIPISLVDLLGDKKEDKEESERIPNKYMEEFVGGTGLSCVLMPNTYHHFHAPVNGIIRHAEVLENYGTYGYPDFPNWVPKDGNVGRPGVDFSQFQRFERGVIIIEVKYANLPGEKEAELTGYVALIPVGLNTIGSVKLAKGIECVEEKGKLCEQKVKRGYTRLGNFLYGGSLNILLFSKGLATGAVQTRMGNQITLFNVGEPIKTK